MANKRILLKKHLGIKYISITTLDYSNSKTQQEVLDETARLSKENDCTKVLVDARPLKTATSVTEVFEFGSRLANIDTLRGGRVAWMTSHLKLAEFLSNVVTNRGLTISLCTNVDAAKEWLFS